ncbi:hypothetical protein VE03_10528 [Pseudogymnoascus sp. 23342-1-I1]|nr:hypothetical protein VE03_10528 [Pseudogymnoascus sp. 23342-1-I1]
MGIGYSLDLSLLTLQRHGRILASRTLHGDFADYHERFHHLDAVLFQTHQTGRPELYDSLSTSSDLDTQKTATTEEVRLLHLSFRDFLLDTEKCEKHPFWINEKKAHKKLAAQCLQRLFRGLKRDICNLQVPEKPRSEVDRQTLDANLPPDIQYACQY